MKFNKPKHFVEITITFIYFAFISLYADLSIDKLAELKPNEFGDFLAGVFAPLAFLWLAFGYFQQGKELQQNTAALQLQADELKNSVEQQKLLLETAQADLDLTKSQTQIQYQKELILAQPFIHLEVTAQKHKIDNRYSLIYVENLFNLNSHRFCRHLLVR